MQNAVEYGIIFRVISETCEVFGRMKEYLSCAMSIGEQMLLCGAEVHRVEDAMQRMCRSFGAVRTDIFIITSSMVATVLGEDGESFTQTRRIHGGGTDMERLHRLNDLCRRICSERMTPAQIRDAYDAILCTPTYPFALECVSYAVIAGSFTLFFGGNLTEAAISFLIGSLIRFVVLFVDRKVINRIFGKCIASFAASALAFVAVQAGIIPSVDKIVIGNIMTLIPGIGLTNALRDLFVGDSITGLLRLADAALNALAIAGGYLLFMCTLGGMTL